MPAGCFAEAAGQEWKAEVLALATCPRRAEMGRFRPQGWCPGCVQGTRGTLAER